jgi:hypothetical protein
VLLAVAVVLFGWRHIRIAWLCLEDKGTEIGGILFYADLGNQPQGIFL